MGDVLTRHSDAIDNAVARLVEATIKGELKWEVAGDDFATSYLDMNLKLSLDGTLNVSVEGKTFNTFARRLVEVVSPSCGIDPTTIFVKRIETAQGKSELIVGLSVLGGLVAFVLGVVFFT